MRPRRRHTTSHHAMQIITNARKQTPSRQGDPQTGAEPNRLTTPATTPWPVTRVP